MRLGLVLLMVSFFCLPALAENNVRCYANSGCPFGDLVMEAFDAQTCRNFGYRSYLNFQDNNCYDLTSFNSSSNEAQILNVGTTCSCPDMRRQCANGDMAVCPPFRFYCNEIIPACDRRGL